MPERHHFVLPIPQPRYLNVPGVRRPAPPRNDPLYSGNPDWNPEGGWPSWYLNPVEEGTDSYFDSHRQYTRRVPDLNRGGGGGGKFSLSKFLVHSS